MNNKTLKMLSSILAFSGGMIAFFASLSYFFEGELLSHLDYNKLNSEAGETITITGIIIFFIALTTLILSILGRHYSSKKLFLVLIILGALLLALLPFIGTISNVAATFLAGLLILSGGILGDLTTR